MGADYHKLPISKVAEVNPERLIVMVDEDNQKDFNNLKESDVWNQLDAVKTIVFMKLIVKHGLNIVV